jgi:hypothetical protein
MENQITNPSFKKLTKQQIIDIINDGGILYKTLCVYSYYSIEYKGMRYYNFNKSSLNSLINSKTITYTLKK